MDLEKDHRDAYVYKQLFVEIRDRYRDYIPVYTDGSRDKVTSEIGAKIKAMEQIKDCFIQSYYMYGLTFVYIFNISNWNNP